MKQYLNIVALVECLGIKRSTLYGWVEQGTIPHLKLGRLLRFDPEEIEAWLQDHRRQGMLQPDSHSRRRHDADRVDVLIAQAKRAVYTSSHGKPDQGRATRKEDSNGSV